MADSPTEHRQPPPHTHTEWLSSSLSTDRVPLPPFPPLTPDTRCIVAKPKSYRWTGLWPTHPLSKDSPPQPPIHWVAELSTEHRQHPHLPTHTLTEWLSRPLSTGRDSLMDWNSSRVMFWTQLAVTIRALRWATTLKKSMNIRHAAIPFWNKHSKVTQTPRRRFFCFVGILHPACLTTPMWLSSHGDPGVVSLDE